MRPPHSIALGFKFEGVKCATENSLTDVEVAAKHYSDGNSMAAIGIYRDVGNIKFRGRDVENLKFRGIYGCQDT